MHFYVKVEEAIKIVLCGLFRKVVYCMLCIIWYQCVVIGAVWFYKFHMKPSPSIWNVVHHAGFCVKNIVYVYEMGCSLKIFICNHVGNKFFFVLWNECEAHCTDLHDKFNKTHTTTNLCAKTRKSFWIKIVFLPWALLLLVRYWVNTSSYRSHLVILDLGSMKYVDDT